MKSAIQLVSLFGIFAAVVHGSHYEDLQRTRDASSVEAMVADTCTVYQIKGDTCGETALDCKYVGPAKTFDPALKDGTCASQGYTVKGKVTQKTVPVIGTITITEYTKPGLSVQVAPSGKYTAAVPFILSMTVNFNGDGTMDFDNNVKIAHQDINCPKSAVTITADKVTFPNIGNTGDCMGDALRKQKKDVTKFYMDINSDGTLTFHSDGWPNLKLKSSSESEVQAAPSGKYTAAVPFILSMTVNFNGDGTMDFDNNVKIAHQDINCPKSAVTITADKVTFPNIGNTGDCMGDALRKQKKDVTKFYIDINSDGTLTFHSDGWPNLKLKPSSEVIIV